MWQTLVRGVSVSAVLMIAISCAKGEDATDVGDVAVPDPDAGRDGGSLLSETGSSSGGDSSSGKDDSSTCVGEVVINELQNNGTNGAEFIELYNAGTCAVPLGNWKLSYRSADDNPGIGSMHAFGSGDSIAAKSFLLFANTKFVGKKDGDLTSGLGNTGGQVGLIDDANKVVDAIGYGTGTHGLYTEKSPAPLPPANGSIGRKSDGVDSDDNASDWKTFTTHSAGVSNP